MGDLISRKALMDYVLNQKSKTIDCNDIARFPAAEAEPVRHGHWIMRGGKRYCSVCRERACLTRDMDDFWYTVGTDYCPTCGAKMDLEV